MKIKSLFIISLCLTSVFWCWAQNIDDLLMRENENVVHEELPVEAITMTVDKDVASGTGKGIVLEEKQDSLAQVSDKWKTYLLIKNDEIQEISVAIQQKETGKIKQEEIDNFILSINTLQKDFNNRKETNGLWQANDELDELRNQFDFACEKELTKLNLWKETRVSKSIPKKYILMVVGILIVMVGLPLFNQIKGSVVAKKAKKLQNLQAKLMRDEAEAQKLLSDDANIVTLTKL